MAQSYANNKGKALMGPGGVEAKFSLKPKAELLTRVESGSGIWAIGLGAFCFGLEHSKWLGCTYGSPQRTCCDTQHCRLGLWSSTFVVSGYGDFFHWQF